MPEKKQRNPETQEFKSYLTQTKGEDFDFKSATSQDALDFKAQQATPEPTKREFKEYNASKAGRTAEEVNARLIADGKINTPEDTTPETTTPETTTPEITTEETTAPETTTPETTTEEIGTPDGIDDKTSQDININYQGKEDTTTPITDIAGFKAAGGGLNNLESFIENRYGANATIDGEIITADINGERFQWKIDNGGNPIKTSLGRIDSEQFLFGQEKSIPTRLINGETVFDPKNIDQAFDIYDRFGTDANISKESNQTIKASTGYQYLKRFKGASTEVIFSGLKTNELGVSGETWDRLVRMNGGVATPEMLQAQKQFEDELKITNINEGNNIIALSYGVSTDNVPETQEEILTQNLKTLDDSFIKTINNVYAQLDTSYSDFKAGNEKLSGLNDDLNSISSQIDELNTSKRDIMDDIQKKYPNMDRSSQIELYNQRADAFDDQLFVLQREYNSKLSTYNFENTQTQSEYNFQIGKSERKLALINSIYNTQRGDIIDARTVARQDRLLEDSITRAEEQRKQSIIDGDIEKAKSAAYEIELFREKAKINQEFSDKFNFTTPTSGVLAKTNNQTGEVELIRVDKEDSQAGTTGTTGTTGTGGVTYRGYEISQDYGASDTPNQDDVAVLANGKKGTPGVDYKTPIGTPVENFVEGEVIGVTTGKTNGKDQGYGNQVIIKDTNGNIHMYSHLDSIDVKIGDNVGKGDIIAKSGNTGFSTGPHLDYRVSSNGKTKLSEGNWIDPKQFVGVSEADKGRRMAEIAGIAVEIFGSRVSDGERETIEKIAEADPDMSSEDIILAVKRFNITKESDRPFANSLLNIALVNQGIEDVQLSGLARLINQGEYSTATQKIENSVLSKFNKDALGNDKIREDKIITAVQRAKELNNLIKQGVDRVGPIEGTMEKWLKSFKSEEAQVISTKMTRLVSQMRNDLLGSAVTPSESLFLEPNVPDLSDKPENLIIKLTDLQSEPLREFNNLRDSAGLPKVTEEQLLDRSLRTSLYNPLYLTDTELPKSGSSVLDRLKGNSSGSGGTSDYEDLIN